MKVLINKQGDKYYVNDDSKDFSFNHGQIKKEQLKKSKVKTNTGKEFYVFEPSFFDKYQKLPRPTQIEQPKDLAGILADVPIEQDWVLLDSGLGSGGFSIFMSRFVKHIYAFEKEKRHFDQAIKNLKKFKVDNVTPKLQNLTKGIDVPPLDFVHLDLPEPWTALEAVTGHLKKGAYLVSYLPNISQIQKLLAVTEKFGLFTLKIKEVSEREWVVDERRSRPKHTALGHTAFLVILRKFK